VEGEALPIYEFYCPDCHMLFSFLSRTVNTTKRPICPRCRKKKLQRQVSLFATRGKGYTGLEGEGEMEGGFDESRMEKAMESMAQKMEGINPDDPRAAAAVMRQLSKEAGFEFQGTMAEALSRMEAGEDPDAIEAELGDAMDDDEPFVDATGKPGGRRGRGTLLAPQRDDTLYDM
jgi:putative FmdB family regulatory protein